MQITKIKLTPVVYRELITKEELLTYFEMRYQEWLRSGYRVTLNQDKLDIDIFDFYSHFMGAFIKEGEKERLVGGVRMVKESLGTAFPILKQICGESQDLKRLCNTLRPYPFSFMEGLSMDRPLKEFSEEGIELVEFGRTVIDPGYRQRGLGIGVLKAVFGFAAHSGIEMGIGISPLKLQSFYEKAGCKTIEVFFHPGYGFNVALLKIDSLRDGY